MKVRVGTKVTTPMPDGLAWPAIAISEETATPTTIVDRATMLPVEIIVTRADFVSLRETREGAPYLAVTNEVVQYGRRIVALPRFETVVGLDADESGEVLTLAQVMAAHAVSYSAFSKAQFDARRTATAAAEL